VFNLSFVSKNTQNLKIRVINIVGEIIYTEQLDRFIGEYLKRVDFSNNAKGIYFLIAETNNGVINKKLILQ
jgi:hypothetical protein